MTKQSVKFQIGQTAKLKKQDGSVERVVVEAINPASLKINGEEVMISEDHFKCFVPSLMDSVIAFAHELEK